MTDHHLIQQDPSRPDPSHPRSGRPGSLRRHLSMRMIVAVAMVLALVTGCSALDQGASSDGGEPVAGSAGIDVGADMAQEAAAASPVQRVETDLAVSQEYLVREAAIGLKVDDIAEAAGRVRQIAAAAGGSVINESFGDDYYGPARTTIDRYGSITIAVPSERLDATIDELTQLGEVRTRSSNSQDVESEYVDVEARIATLEASIERMRDLMTQTNDIDQIVKLETALSSRQADLDSLQARLNALSARIAMSPVSVMLTTTDDLGEPTGGFLGALKDSWEAMKTSAGILLTAAGALLPWVVVGGLGTWALVWVIRRAQGRRRDRAASEQQYPAAPPQQPVAQPATQPQRQAGQRDPTAEPEQPRAEQPRTEEPQPEQPRTEQPRTEGPRAEQVPPVRSD